MNAPKQLRPWTGLSAEEQLALSRDYQTELDKQPLTCSLDEKTARFAAWLEERGISFTISDVRRPKPD